MGRERGGVWAEVVQCDVRCGVWAEVVQCDVRCGVWAEVVRCDVRCGVWAEVVQCDGRCGVWAEVVRCDVRYTLSLPGAAELRRKNSSTGYPVFNRLAPELFFFLILAHPVYKM